MCKDPGVIAGLVECEEGWLREEGSDHAGRQKQQTLVRDHVGSRKREVSKRSQKKRL